MSNASMTYGLCSLLLLTGMTMAAEKPNILLILSDDNGAHSLSGLGGTIPTPNLDRLLESGMNFTHAHAAPMCAPTRDEMMTGVSRVRSKGRPGLETPFFTNALQDLGYRTGIAGKWFVGSVFDPPSRGFDEAFILVNGYRHWAPDVMVFGSKGLWKELNQPPVGKRLIEWTMPLEGDSPHLAKRFPKRHGEDMAVEFISDFIRRNRDQPFFAYYPSKLVHVPQVPTPQGDPKEREAYAKAFARCFNRSFNDLPKLIEEECERLGVHPNLKTYRDDAMRYLDRNVGELIGLLDELELRRKTVVIYLSDNGNSALDPLPENAVRIPGKKGDCREGGTRVPLIVSWPGVVQAGSQCDDLVHVQDFLPSIIELAGGKVPSDRPIDGLSFAGRLQGKKEPVREYIIGQGAHHNVWLDRVAKELGNEDLKPYKLAWVHDKGLKLYSDGRFYDLHADPAEAHAIPSGKGGAAAEKIRVEWQAVLNGLKAK